MTLHESPVPHSITIWKQLERPTPTPVYDAYWYLAAERQAIFFRRFLGLAGPWTADPILMRYKFTNAYRASDRVSQYLITNVIYNGDQAADELFFRILLFKLFNRIETWELLTASLGPLHYRSYCFNEYDRVLTTAMSRGERIYSGAYIMPVYAGPKGASRGLRKHRMHLNLLERMMADGIPDRIASMSSMRGAFELLKTYPMLGDFLAYQYVTDLNYSALTSFSEREFVVPGPGARSGIRKCFRTLGGLTERDVIRLVTEEQNEEFSQRHLSFRPLWGRELQYIDCQNLFCEVDKYARVRHPDVAGVSHRTRIKQQFRPTSAPLQYWYPPKWGINESIPRTTSEQDGNAALYQGVGSCVS